MTSFAVLQTIPILRIFDVPKAREFYVDFLGFTVEWEHQFDERAPVYMQIARSGLTLHLSQHHGDACPGSTLHVRFEGLDEFHAELKAKNYGHLRPGINKTFHHSRQVEVIDPFGNKIRFDEPDEPAPSSA